MSSSHPPPPSPLSDEKGLVGILFKKKKPTTWNLTSNWLSERSPRMIFRGWVKYRRQTRKLLRRSSKLIVYDLDWRRAKCVCFCPFPWTKKTRGSEKIAEVFAFLLYFLTQNPPLFFSVCQHFNLKYIAPLKCLRLQKSILKITRTERRTLTFTAVWASESGTAVFYWRHHCSQFYFILWAIRYSESDENKNV